MENLTASEGCQLSCTLQWGPLMMPGDSICIHDPYSEPTAREIVYWYRMAMPLKRKHMPLVKTRSRKPWRSPLLEHQALVQSRKRGSCLDTKRTNLDLIHQIFYCCGGAVAYLQAGLHDELGSSYSILPLNDQCGDRKKLQHRTQGCTAHHRYVPFKYLNGTASLYLPGPSWPEWMCTTSCCLCTTLLRILYWDF